MDAYVIWFCAAALLVVIEMISGTFYLLMIAIGVAAAGAAALAGASMIGQFLIAAVVSLAGIAWVRRRRFGASKPGEGERMSFDVGQAVEVLERRADGTLRVFYRGTQWDAELDAGIAHGESAQAMTTDLEKSYVIKAMRGSRLLLVPHAPRASS